MFSPGRLRIDCTANVPPPPPPLQIVRRNFVSQVDLRLQPRVLPVSEETKQESVSEVAVTQAGFTADGNWMATVRLCSVPHGVYFWGGGPTAVLTAMGVRLPLCLIRCPPPPLQLSPLV